MPFGKMQKFFPHMNEWKVVAFTFRADPGLPRIDWVSALASKQCCCCYDYQARISQLHYQLHHGGQGGKVWLQTKKNERNESLPPLSVFENHTKNVKNQVKMKNTSSSHFITRARCFVLILSLLSFRDWVTRSIQRDASRLIILAFSESPCRLSELTPRGFNIFTPIISYLDFLGAIPP